MSDFSELRKALLKRILEEAGAASYSDRRAAFSLTGLTGPLGALVEKVAKQAYRTHDDDIAAVKASGLTKRDVPPKSSHERLLLEFPWPQRGFHDTRLDAHDGTVTTGVVAPPFNAKFCTRDWCISPL